MTWLSQNLGTIIVLMILAAVVAGIVYSMVKNRKKGKSSCGCNCSCCSTGDACPGHKRL